MSRDRGGVVTFQIYLDRLIFMETWMGFIGHDTWRVIQRCKKIYIEILITKSEIDDDFVFQRSLHLALAFRFLSFHVKSREKLRFLRVKASPKASKSKTQFPRVSRYVQGESTCLSLRLLLARIRNNSFSIRIVRARSENSRQKFDDSFSS